MDPVKSLLRSHLTDAEADLYLALLHLGKARVTTIAKHLDIHRSLAYFHLQHLQDKGYARESRSGTIKQFVATPPETIAKRLQEESTAFLSAIPLFERLRHPDPQTPVIEVFESRKGFLRIYQEVGQLEPGSLFRVIEGKRALAGELNLLTQTEWQEFFTKMIEHKIETKALFTQESYALPRKTFSKHTQQLLQERIWHMRLIPEQTLPFDELVIVYGHKIAFLFPDNQLVVTIEHVGIARSMSIFFDTLFLLGSPTKESWKERS